MVGRGHEGEGQSRVQQFLRGKEDPQADLKRAVNMAERELLGVRPGMSSRDFQAQYPRLRLSLRNPFRFADATQLVPYDETVLLSPGSIHVLRGQLSLKEGAHSKGLQLSVENPGRQPVTFDVGELQDTFLPRTYENRDVVCIMDARTKQIFPRVLLAPRR